MKMMCGEEPAWLTSWLASSSSSPLCFYPINSSSYRKQSMKWQWLDLVSNTGCSCRSLSGWRCACFPLSLGSSFVSPPTVELLGCRWWSSGHGLAPSGKPTQRPLSTAQPGQGLQIHCYYCTVCPTGEVFFSSCAPEHGLFAMISWILYSTGWRKSK